MKTFLCVHGKKISSIIFIIADKSKFIQDVKKKNLPGSLIGHTMCVVDPPHTVMVSAEKALPELSRMKAYFQDTGHNGGQIKHLESTEDGCCKIEFKEPKSMLFMYGFLAHMRLRLK